MKKKQKLIPADRKRCQAEKPNGATFMSLGCVPKLIRCENKPLWLLKENKPGADGLTGSMTLCDDCLKKFQEQMSPDFAIIKRLPGISQWR